MFETEPAGHHLRQRVVSPVRVVQDQLPDARARDARSDLLPLRRRRLRCYPHRSREPAVLAAHADVQRGQREDADVVADELQRAGEQRGVVHGVDAQGKVRAVRLGGAQGQHGHGVAEVRGGEVLRGPLRPQPAHLPSSRRRRVRRVRRFVRRVRLFVRLFVRPLLRRVRVGWFFVRVFVRGCAVALRESVRRGEGPARVRRLRRRLALLPRSHLSRVQHPVRVRAGLEPELRPVRLLHPAVLQHVRVGVKHRNVVLLVPSHHLLHLTDRGFGVGTGPEQRQRREPDPTPEPDHLQVLHELVDVVPPLHGAHQVESLPGHHRRLQVRHGLVPLQRVQGGVIPRVLVQRDAQS
mmetsp:Transcript_2046/g.9010  ORF Transcript_2046/g.9010 Transcript_2046/m.9010 type:complete len:352 (+) Transcript_2046:523-1578(+)